MFARVERGERLIVTRDSHPVAELRPLPARSAGPAELPVSMGTLAMNSQRSIRWWTAVAEPRANW